MEIERKFLITQAPHLHRRRSVRIEQGYLSGGEDEVRVRRKGDGFWLTVKRGAGMVRTEQEVALDREQFETLWPLTSGRRVEKDRTVISDGGRTIELDVFDNELRGLVVAEVEFEDEAEARAFVPPGWFGREVTDDARYKNHALAVLGLPAADAAQS
jgi:CYTH domain-containing protein